MVEPEDDIVVVLFAVELRSSDRDGLVRVVGEDCEGAGCVKANAADGAGVDIVLVQGTLNRGANAAPDVVGGLFLPCVSFVLFLLLTSSRAKLT